MIEIERHRDFHNSEVIRLPRVGYELGKLRWEYAKSFPEDILYSDNLNSCV